MSYSHHLGAGPDSSIQNSFGDYPAGDYSDGGFLSRYSDASRLLQRSDYAVSSPRTIKYAVPAFNALLCVCLALLVFIMVRWCG